MEGGPQTKQPALLPAPGKGGTHHGKETSLPPSARSPPGEPPGVRRTGSPPPPRRADPPMANQAATGARGCPATPAERLYPGGVRWRRRGTGPGTTGVMEPRRGPPPLSPPLPPPACGPRECRPSTPPEAEERPPSPRRGSGARGGRR